MTARALALACATVVCAASRTGAADLPPAAPQPAVVTPVAPVMAATPVTPVAPVAPVLAVRSSGLLAGGVLASVVGGVAMVLGIVRIATIAACPGTCSNPKGNQTIGGVVLGVGAVVLAGGIVMAVIGGKKVPMSGAGAVSAAPAWVGEPGGVGWGWRF